VYDEFDMQGATAIGVTGVDGRFMLLTPSASAVGVYPGRYKVGLIPPKRSRPAFRTGNWERFWYPTTFADPNESGLEIEVRQDSKNDFAFELSQKSRKR
jgi:hypothetical protein